ncbi:hypothetical protein BGZ57DRAFT_1006291 [Hyaloscypha finlandica]|nr:hypothetical protein BGZ57DRAFT_1006291 [Hyaloscypha finlandica]
MSNWNMNYGTAGRTPTTPSKADSFTGFKGLRPRDTARDIDKFDNTNLSPTPGPTETSPLESWINEYDSGKAASGRGTPSVTSAYSRLTFVAAVAPPTSGTASPSKSPRYDLPVSARNQMISPKTSPQDIASPSSYKQPRYRPLLSRFKTPPGPASPNPSTNAGADPSSNSASYISGGDNPRSPIFAGPPRSQPAPLLTAFTNAVDPGPTDSDMFLDYSTGVFKNSTSRPIPQLKFLSQPSSLPVNSWDSASLTRYWTQDLVRTAILRIMGELNLDFYEDNYRFFDFDGSPHVVEKLWQETMLVYTQFINSYVYGLDILTLIAMHENALSGGPLANINAVLADMICFFAAGKIGMEKRAEDMAQALISGGDIICFVSRRCAENGLEYPGGVGRTEDRVMQACIQETFRSGW